METQNDSKQIAICRDGQTVDSYFFQLPKKLFEKLNNLSLPEMLKYFKINNEVPIEQIDDLTKLVDVDPADITTIIASASGYLFINDLKSVNLHHGINAQRSIKDFLKNNGVTILSVDDEVVVVGSDLSTMVDIDSAIVNLNYTNEICSFLQEHQVTNVHIVMADKREIDKLNERLMSKEDKNSQSEVNNPPEELVALLDEAIEFHSNYLSIHMLGDSVTYKLLTDREGFMPEPSTDNIFEPLMYLLQAADISKQSLFEDCNQTSVNYRSKARGQLKLHITTVPLVASQSVAITIEIERQFGSFNLPPLHSHYLKSFNLEKLENEASHVLIEKDSKTDCRMLNYQILQKLKELSKATSCNIIVDSHYQELIKDNWCFHIDLTKADTNHLAALNPEFVYLGEITTIAQQTMAKKLIASGLKILAIAPETVIKSLGEA